MGKMCMTPLSLKTLCIKYVCYNIEHLYPCDTFLPMELSEELLKNLSLANLINDKTLSLFRSENAHLRSIILPTTNRATSKGLWILHTHKLKKIEIHILNCKVDTIIDSLNMWTIENLEVLDVSKMHIEYNSEASREFDTNIFSTLKNLRALNVSKTNFSTKHLLTVIEDLPHLESLNISSTKVDNLLPLNKMKNKLKILSIYNLRQAITKMVDFAPLRCMKSLTHLDLSFSFHESFSYKSLLADPHWLPNLEALDISGSKNVGRRIWEKFLTTHKNLTFLGLIYMNDSRRDIFNNPNHPLYNKDLVVTGFMKKNQLLHSVPFYMDRTVYVFKCLDCIKRMTDNYNIKPSTLELIKVVLNVMKYYRDDYLVHMSASICLYNLTRKRLALKIHSSMLTLIVDILLNAMERFSYVGLLQEITFLILNNKYLLRNVKMDYVRWTILILNEYQFSRINGIIIELFSKIASKMSLFEISQLNLNSRSLLNFMAIVYGKLSNRTIDSELKSSINVLWSLTDECPSSCEVFMNLDGLQIFMNILNTHIDNNSLVNKVLRVLINISKIPHLRFALLNNGVIPILRHLMQSKKIRISYCAAEIIAHLACEPSWKTYTLNSKGEILKDLELAVKEWAPPEKIIVMYRSFQSFIDLFNSIDTPQAQLWAAWAILHVCTINGKKYCAMLSKDIGVFFFKNISSDESIDLEVRGLCDRIIYLMN